jgi:hypothetical protein
MRRRHLSPYTFFYQCFVAFCGKSCAEEENGSVAQGSSSFMLPGESCVDVDAQLLYSVINKWHGEKAVFEVVVASGRSVTTTSLDVGEADLSVSGVISFRLG